MRVEPDVLKDGAGVSRNAGQIVNDGADALAQAVIPAGIFGDFEAAHSFHGRLSAGHRSQVQAMRGNHRTLTDVGDKAYRAALSFEHTEADNRARIDAVPEQGVPGLDA
ncbi:DUF2563 family protein [Mycolicibacterium sp. 120270]|uniref:DUF2563 family protein n=1 Tax=Mycolicibacterium sp. 120270 TaxID=3090600 RepID=UPI00299E7D3E|nr:DUF2563 family protein [Mycolicibacterium sp. 120270]MDX1883506.1 DUF2563 family protein [Mycolicibacterium sp. 120270]